MSRDFTPEPQRSFEPLAPELLDHLASRTPIERRAAWESRLAHDEELASQARLLEFLAAAFLGEGEATPADFLGDRVDRESQRTSPNDSAPDATATLPPARLSQLTRSLQTANSETVAAAFAQLRPRLDARAWQAFWSVEVEGRTVDEAARECALSHVDVQVHCYRIGKLFQQELQRDPA